VTIGDGLTQDTRVVRHALHPVTVVTDAKVILLEDVKPDIELQNTRPTVAEELSLHCEPRLTCSLRRFLNDLVGFGEKGVEDPCHNDVVQSGPKDERISDIEEDVAIQGVATKREMHEIASPLVVAR
jgi:hypothetical protein